MIETKKGYRFECSGRHFLTHLTECISLAEDGSVMCGYDHIADVWDDNNDEYDSNFTDEEKKELALFMIEKWKHFGGIVNSIQ